VGIKPTLLADPLGAWRAVAPPAVHRLVVARDQDLLRRRLGLLDELREEREVLRPRVAAVLETANPSASKPNESIGNDAAGEAPYLKQRVARVGGCYLELLGATPVDVVE
jgi:hypothetical protein